MATPSTYLFVTGALLLLFAFVLDVAYTTLLAVGRRATTSPQLATAGPDGSAPALDGPSDPPGADTVAALAHGLTWASFLLMAGSLAARAIVVERRRDPIGAGRGQLR